MYYKHNIKARSRNYWRRGKAISITYYECVSVVLVIQHSKRMRRIILSSVACLAVPCFSTSSHWQFIVLGAVPVIIVKSIRLSTTVKCMSKYLFLHERVTSPSVKPPTWRTRVWPIILRLSDKNEDMEQELNVTPIIANIGSYRKRWEERLLRTDA
jgi:hypothetical protein